MKWLIVVCALLVGCGPKLSKKPEGSDPPDSGHVGSDGGLDAGGDFGTGQDTGGGHDAEQGEDVGPDSPEDDVGPSNSVPSVSMVAIAPAAPDRPGEQLTCSYTFMDADGDANQSTVEWLVNGAVEATGTTFSAYGPDDEVQCRVTPRDEVSSGQSVTSDPIVGPAGAVVSSGYNHTCLLTTTGGVRCWGSNYDGAVGANTSTESGPPVPPTTPAGLGSGVTQVAAGGLVSCAIQNGAAKCWGSGAWGVVGPGETSDVVTPTTILPSGVTQIATGEVHVCAIQNGALKCWGANDHGQLGNTVENNEDFGKNPTPTIAAGLGSGVTKVAAGQYHTCVIQNGALKCFGYNAFGQLGRADNLDPDVANPTPTTVPGLSSGVTDVAAGRYFTCAVHNGDLKCWGNGKADQLGFAVTDFETTPTTVPNVSGTIDRLSAGGSNVCIVQDRVVKCWGDNVYDQLLASTPGGSSTTPVTILDPTIGSISVGDTHVCAEQNGDLYCWGDNYDGQLGVDEGVGTFDSSPPVVVTY